MRTVERERHPGALDAGDEVPIANAMRPSTTQFVDGPAPPVGGSFQSPGPTASERAYDDPMMPKELLDIVAKGDVSDLSQMLAVYPTLRRAILGAITRTHGAQAAQAAGQQSKKAAPQQQPVGETKSTAKALPEGYDDGPIRVDEDHTGDRQKVAGFDQIAMSHTREGAAPSHIRLPPSLVKALDTMWAESAAKNQEQGGNLVRTYGGEYKVKRTHDEDDNASTYTPDTSNVGRFDTHVAIVHTHPLDKTRPDGVTFGADDIIGLVDEDQPLNILRAGNNTYVISRTKEFDALVDRTNNEPEKLSDLRRSMMETYKAAFDAENAAGGGPASQVEKGLIAMCRQFHLIYYWGQGQDLHRVR